MQVAQRALEFFVIGAARRPQQCLDKIDKVIVRKWFFEKVDRAQPGGLFPMRGQMDCRENDRARIRVTRAQIVKEFLAEIVGRIDIEHEEVGPDTHDQSLRFFQAPRQIDVGAGRGFFQRTSDRRREMRVRFQNQNAAILF